MTTQTLWAWVQAHALAVWPAFTAILILVFRTRTPAEWVALGERSPRVQGFIRFLRGAGFDPSKTLAGLVQLITGRAPPSIQAMVATATPEPPDLARQLYEAYGDRVGWRSVTGAQMPAWGDLPERIRNAWGASAAAAIDAMTWVPASSVPVPVARTSRASSAPSGQSGRATVATLVLLALVGALGLAACPRAREAVLDTQSPRVACAADTQRCHDGAPEVCSRAGRWWPAMPPHDDGTRRRCADVCEVSAAGIAHCASSQVVTP